jgi:hypothetical protein
MRQYSPSETIVRVNDQNRKRIIPQTYIEINCFRGDLIVGQLPLGILRTFTVTSI